MHKIKEYDIQKHQLYNYKDKYQSKCKYLQYIICNVKENLNSRIYVLHILLILH